MLEAALVALAPLRRIEKVAERLRLVLVLLVALLVLLVAAVNRMFMSRIARYITCHFSMAVKGCRRAARSVSNRAWAVASKGSLANSKHQA